MAAMMPKPLPRMRLQGFNNLTKSLSFTLYDVCYAKSATERAQYLAYIDEEYNADRLTALLMDVTRMIGATPLNVARQDYDPQGASVTMLIAEEPTAEPTQSLSGTEAEQLYLAKNQQAFKRDTVVCHLDKSHICVHTYPEHHPDNGICTFRADIEVSTCGQISPLSALNFLIEEFDPDVLALDYRVRGFTRNVRGKKHWIDHKISSIQDFIDQRTKRNYQAADMNLRQANLFHTSMCWKQVDLPRYLFGGQASADKLNEHERRKIERQLTREINEIFSGENVPA